MKGSNIVLAIVLAIAAIFLVQLVKQISSSESEPGASVPSAIIYGDYILQLPDGFTVEEMPKDQLIRETGLSEDALKLIGFEDVKMSMFTTRSENQFGYFMWMAISDSTEYNLMGGTKESVKGAVSKIGTPMEHDTYGQDSMMGCEGVKVFGNTNIKGEPFKIQARYLLDNEPGDRQIVGLIVMSDMGSLASRLFEGFWSAKHNDWVKRESDSTSKAN